MEKQRSLHYFNPANDLALALDLQNYTPPPAAVELAKAGGCLPLWYGKSGDSFITDGLNREWYERIVSQFDIDVSPWNHSIDNWQPTPWGWSKVAKTFFKKQGFHDEDLPSDQELSEIRALSGRKSSVFLAEDLHKEGLCPEEFVGRVINDKNDAVDFVKKYGDVIFKLPWSSSGRGQIRVGRSDEFFKHSQAVLGAIKRYGYVTAEKFHRDKVADFALLFEIKDTVEFRGLSFFETEANGDYSCNFLESNEMILERLVNLGVKGIDNLVKGLFSSLEKLLYKKYQGPLGIDMMVLEGGRVVPCVEINLRMTMGFVARYLYDKYIDNGSKGIFKFLHGIPGENLSNPVIHNGRLKHGDLQLNPSSNKIKIVAKLF